MKAMCPLALFQPNEKTSSIGLMIAQKLRQDGYGCDLAVFDKYKKIFRWAYESDRRIRQPYNRVWILGNAEAERGKILYCTQGGRREEWDIESFIEPDEEEQCPACGEKK